MSLYSAIHARDELRGQGLWASVFPSGSRGWLEKRFRPFREYAAELLRPRYAGFTADLIRWTLVFWAAVYILNTVRSVLNPYPHLLLQAGLRVLAVGVGVCLSGALILFFRRLPRSAQRPLIILAAAAAGNLIYVIANYTIFYALPGIWTPPHGALAKILSYFFEFFWLFPSWVAGFLFLEHRHGQSTLLRSSEPAAIWADEGGVQTRVPIEGVLWVESEGDYVRLHTGGKSHLIRGTLRVMEEHLAPHGFVRIHRRFLVGEALIEKTRRTGDGRLLVILTNGTELPIGRNYVRRVRMLALSTH